MLEVDRRSFRTFRRIVKFERQNPAPKGEVGHWTGFKTPPKSLAQGRSSLPPI